MMEACWLGIVLILPLIFNPESERIFEPEKLAIFRSLVAIMLAAWLVKTIEQALSPQASLQAQLKSQLKNPVVLIILLLTVSYIFQPSFQLLRRAVFGALIIASKDC
jgi:hypothetical protein